MTTIRVSNEERDAAMPDWVDRNEVLRHYWQANLEARCDLAAADQDEYRETAIARIRARLEQRYQDWMSQ